MDPEEKELIKKLLSKIDSLEKEVKELREGRKVTVTSAQEINKNLKFPPIKTQDKLARLIIKKAREKVIREAVEGAEPRRTSRSLSSEEMKAKVEEIRKNFDLGEVALFALKKNLIKRGKESEESDTGRVIIKE